MNARTKLREYEPGETVIVYGWGGGREVRVVAHNDAITTTLQNLRTGRTWNVQSDSRCRCPVEARAHLIEQFETGVNYHGNIRFGEGEWMGWDSEGRLRYAHSSPVGRRLHAKRIAK